MTSPTQLTYLEAMGIPVWVSRDLVQLTSAIIQIEKSEAPELVSAETSVEQQQSALKTNTTSTSTSNAVQSILDDLSNTSVKKESRLANDKHKTSIDEITLKSSQVPSISESIAESTNQHADENSKQNLIHKTPIYNIYGSGNDAADWLIIGYSPEAFNGIGNEPFAGEVGLLLDNMIRAVGIERPRMQAYYVNIFEHYGSQPEATDKTQLHDYLYGMIEKVKPKMVLLVGQNAAQTVLKSKEPLVILRANTHLLEGLSIPAVVSYYPSYLLSKPSDKRKAWNDLKRAMQLLSVDDG